MISATGSVIAHRFHMRRRCLQPRGQAQPRDNARRARPDRDSRVRFSTPKNCARRRGGVSWNHVVAHGPLRRLRPRVRAAVRVPGRGVSTGERRYFCALGCRKAGLGDAAFAGQRRSRRVAILNQKGGTGKTTTAVNLAAGIADRGLDTLLVDVDAQGNVGTSLGIRGERTLYHILVDAATRPEDVIVPVRGHLDVITADATLALAEVFLARIDGGRDRVLADRLAPLRARYQYVVLDCGPSLSLLNQNALSFADEVLIPVSCDYLALVGVKQVLQDPQGHRQAPRPHRAHLRRGADLLRRAHAPRRARRSTR